MGWAFVFGYTGAICQAGLMSRCRAIRRLSLCMDASGMGMGVGVVVYLNPTLDTGNRKSEGIERGMLRTMSHLLDVGGDR